MITVDKLYDIAKVRLIQHFDYVDFSTNPKITDRIAEILAADAMMKAGISISIRWLYAEDQDKYLNGIEQLMFDLAFEDKSMLKFYEDMINHNAEPMGNMLSIRQGSFRHHAHYNQGVLG